MRLKVNANSVKGMRLNGAFSNYTRFPETSPHGMGFFKVGMRSRNLVSEDTHLIHWFLDTTLN